MKHKKTTSKTLSFVVPDGTAVIIKQLYGLAEQLNCPVSNLIWYSLINLVRCPPGAKDIVHYNSSNPGFWVSHLTSTKLRYQISRIAIKEVNNKKEFKLGRDFFSYYYGNKCSRMAALKRAHKYACTLGTSLGLVNCHPTVTLLSYRKRN